MGDEEELDEAAKMKIAGNFIMHSPPGQTQKVVDDVKTLCGGQIADADTVDAMVAKVNSAGFLAVAVPGESRQVLLTPFGDLGDGAFLDPKGQQKLIIDHVKQVCKRTDALEPAQTAGLETKYRDEVDLAMSLYAADKLPDAVVTTYGSKSGSTVKITCCIARCNINLTNYWAGLWRSHWVLEFAEGSKSGKLSGTVRSNVHYFEDGNVQLDDGTKFACELKFSKGVGESMAAQVLEYEMEFNAGMEDIYVSMSEQVLQGLRRRLPVTRVKFDWDNKASVHKLASDLRSH